MNNIVRIITTLCNSFPELKLFWDTHFEIVKRNHLTPVFNDKLEPEFPEELEIRRKALSVEDKIFFYKDDYVLWEELINEQRRKKESDSDE